MSKRNDISEQIRKYLNGELDARAMHQLEKEAQNDPFLMEALEGYEKTTPDQQKNIDDIHARIEARINKREARVIPWRMISIAASILVILTIGGLWINYQQPTPEQKTVAKLSLPSPKKATVDTAHKKETLIAVLPPKAKQKSVVYTQEAAPIASADGATGNAPGSADITIDAPVGNSDAKVAEVEPVQVPVKKDSAHAELAEVAINSKALTGRAAGVAVYKAQTRKISGIVKDETGPLPGVTVKVKGTNTGVVTDVNGKFTLSSVPDNATLDLAFVGYQSKQITVRKRDSLVIAMQPSSNSLSEVVVTGYGTQKEQEQEYLAPQPAAGWNDYNKYLKDNAKSPDGKTGTVKLSFIVNTDNSLSDFRIIKSVSAKTDSAAIDLINNGPDWQKSNSGKAEKVKLRIKFPGK